jgi:hypothetical protein
MQAIELETPIVNGEIHAKLPTAINAEKARLIILYEAIPTAPTEAQSGLLQLLDDITLQRNWPEKSKADIDSQLEAERASWD